MVEDKAKHHSIKDNPCVTVQNIAKKDQLNQLNSSSPPPGGAGAGGGGGAGGRGGEVRLLPGLLPHQDHLLPLRRQGH